MTMNILLQKIEKFIKRTGIPAATLGREALNDPAFVSDLRDGRSPSMRTVEKLEAYMTEKLAK